MSINAPPIVIKGDSPLAASLLTSAILRHKPQRPVKAKYFYNARAFLMREKCKKREASFADIGHVYNKVIIEAVLRASSRNVMREIIFRPVMAAGVPIGNRASKKPIPKAAYVLIAAAAVSANCGPRPRAGAIASAIASSCASGPEWPWPRLAAPRRRHLKLECIRNGANRKPAASHLARQPSAM